jgi:hypothetical protein
MDNHQVKSLLAWMRWNAHNSAYPNMKKAIDGGAPVAALVYGLAYIGAMSGFYMRGSNGKRYREFVREYLSPAFSGCDYGNLDLYGSLRCHMLHGLVPGQRPPGKGKCVFTLVQDRPDVHGKPGSDDSVWFDVEVFCSDAFHAACQFMDDVEKAMLQTPEPALLTNFNARIKEGYTILVSH